ncbi:acid protease [Russula decolorans]
MYFSSAFVLVALPFLVGAVLVQNSARSALSIPLSKRSTLSVAGLVDVQNLQASVHHTLAKIEQGFDAFERNTGKRHPLVSKQGHPNNRRSVAATIPLTNYTTTNYTMWYFNISVGTPATTFTVDFDTGSAAMFLRGPPCLTCTVYNATQSSTAKDLGTNSTLDFGEGEVEGGIFMDNISAGGFEAFNQTFLVASSYHSFELYSADGVIGMGFKEISTFNATPFFETLVDEGQLAEPVFGVYLNASYSELIIGGRNSSLYPGNELAYVNVTTQGYWQIAFDFISVNGHNISVSTQEAIIDTGTRLIVGDNESISNIYAMIPGSASMQNGLWTIPCNTSVTVIIVFGGIPFFMFPKTYNIGAISTSGDTCVGGFSTAPTDTAGFWVIGDIFLQTVYTEFDYGEQRVGFAQIEGLDNT